MCVCVLDVDFNFLLDIDLLELLLLDEEFLFWQEVVDKGVVVSGEHFGGHEGKSV